MTDGDHESASRGSGRMQEGSGWDWIDDYPIAFTLMFVRAVTPERVIEAFGADPADAELLTAEATGLTLGYPWVRAGRNVPVREFLCEDRRDADRRLAQVAVGSASQEHPRPARRDRGRH